MPALEDVLERVDARFAQRADELVEWADPHPDRQPLDEEYSRLLNPGKWKILGGRADAWADALAELGSARVEPVEAADLVWVTAPIPVLTSALRLVPAVRAALPLVVGRSRMGDVDDAGVVLGVGEPAIVLDVFPDCGCDACDSGSQDELDRIDRALVGVVTGAFRRLIRGDTTITVGVGHGLSWSSTGIGVRHLSRAQVEAVLIDPTGWHEVTGAPWL